ncbi:MAG TPA: NBR1-Ig-like domain-containing protein [Ktedonobacterales bacterium]|jgi:surface antigen|nr:NBR1-Ig-like domain-containing protein [Ktedonobacterales bacterium]
MRSASMRLPKVALALFLVLGALASVWIVAVPRAHADSLLTNPYTGTYGPPNCTWYAWQRLHDTQHIDLQFTANAGDWANRAQQPNAAWDEDTGAFVVPQITTSPAVGDILVLPLESRYARPYHVAFVEEIYSNGSFLVSQQSFGDYSPGQNTSPYPYVRHGTWRLDDVQQAEQNRARFLHFSKPSTETAAPEDDAATVSTVPSLSPGVDQPFDVEIVLENTGQTTWDDTQGYQLACISPDCLGTATVDMGAQLVEPGQQHTFIVHLTAPHDLATVDTKWMMQHNGTVFGVAVPIQVVVGPSTDDQAEIVSQTAPSSMQAGQQYSAVFVIRNAGRSTWSSQAGYGLACVADCMRAQSPRPLTQAVGPGDQVTFTIDEITAPQSSGIYTPIWQMTTTKGTFGPQLSAIISVASPWTAWYEVQRPSCDDPAAWTNTNQAAVSDCTRSDGLALSQSSDATSAELDLTAPNGQQGYDLSRTRVRTQAAFLNAGNTNVWAALVVQTPQDGTCGGFLLAINAAGLWKLQQTSSDCTISTISSGQVTLDPASFTMQVLLQNGQLAANIDGQSVVPRIADTLSSSSGIVGLMEQSPQATTSAVVYSDFAIDHWS